ncbi:MAG: MFS transporter [Pseudomonadota bacterium]|nr:MFS transporter [Pseudomonadota bacterium]
MFVGWGATYVIVVALKPIAQEFGWPRAVPSLAISFQFVGSGIGGILMGLLLDKTDMGKPALVGTLMISGGALAASAITAAWQLHIIYALMIGVFGVGSLSAPLLANIVRWFEFRKGMAVGVVTSGQALAGIIWTPIFGWTISEMGWRDTFFWYGIAAFCLMLPICLFIGRSPPKTEQPAVRAPSGALPAQAIGPERKLATNFMQISLCIAIVGCCIAMSLPLAHLVSHATDLGIPINHAVQIMSLMLATTFLTRFFAVGLLSDSFGGLRALIAFSVVQAVSLALLTVVDGMVALYVVAAIFGFGYGGIFPVYAVIVREHLPIMEVGRRTGLVFFFGATGMGIGSWMGGQLYDMTGSYVSAFLIGVAFNVFNLVLIAALTFRTGRNIRQAAIA